MSTFVLLLGLLAAAPPEKVVIPFDFESKFDDGRYGRIVGDLLWSKLKKQGGFILPESMQDVRDYCERTKTLPNPDTPLDRLRASVVDDQAGDLAIWGKVERVEGEATDVYDVWIRVADFSTSPPKLLYARQARTKTVSEIPHVYVKEALDRLYGRPAETAAAKADAPDVARRWATGPNLLRGDFEQAAGDHPLGWDPLPPQAAWIVEPSGKAKNHILRFHFDEDVAGTTGVLYYSDYFPVEPGATYRFQCRWRTDGAAAKVFVKCYDELTAAGFDPHRREVYRSQQNLVGDKGVWNTHSEDFTPKHAQFRPRWGRVMLYAYWPAGTVEWDDVVVKLVRPK